LRRHANLAPKGRQFCQYGGHIHMFCVNWRQTRQVDGTKRWNIYCRINFQHCSQSTSLSAALNFGSRLLFVYFSSHTACIINIIVIIKIATDIASNARTSAFCCMKHSSSFTATLGVASTFGVSSVQVAIKADKNKHQHDDHRMCLEQCASGQKVPGVLAKTMMSSRYTTVRFPTGGP